MISLWLELEVNWIKSKYLTLLDKKQVAYMHCVCASVKTCNRYPIVCDLDTDI
jgi:hypothetical protein